MRLFGNPFVWLMRIHHRCGYGVHSPFAFRFLTEVVYEQAPYYAYRRLDAGLPWRMCLRRRKGLHLLLRLANWLQPEVIVLSGNHPWIRTYLMAGCSKAVIYGHMPAGGADMVVLDAPDDEAESLVHEGGMLVLDGLSGHEEWLRGLRATVTFDLYDLGIAIYNKKLQRQHYRVNF